MWTLSVIIALTCPEVDSLIAKTKTSEHLTNEQRKEVIEVLQESSSPKCEQQS